LDYENAIEFDGVFYGRLSSDSQIIHIGINPSLSTRAHGPSLRTYSGIFVGICLNQFFSGQFKDHARNFV
jgi:hypothetical protein